MWNLVGRRVDEKRVHSFGKGSDDLLSFRWNDNDIIYRHRACISENFLIGSKHCSIPRTYFAGREFVGNRDKVMIISRILLKLYRLIYHRFRVLFSFHFIFHFKYYLTGILCVCVCVCMCVRWLTDGFER